jgi:type II secretory ATPase GspE/PulE/Tfp pilus assembly ATPase PilB-like protein
MGIDPLNFADALLGILAQRLVRTLCPNCKEPYHPTREEYDEIAQSYGEEEFAKLNIPYGNSFRLRPRDATVRQDRLQGSGWYYELVVAPTDQTLIHNMNPWKPAQQAISEA